MHRFTGRQVVVTGGSLGIGRAAVDAFLAEGATVVTSARTTRPEIAELEAREPRFTFVAADLATTEGATTLATAALVSGPVDVLVNNVGGGRPTLPRNGFLDVTDDDWLDVYALNVLSAVRMIRAVLPGMRERGAGAIVNVGSMRSVVPKVASPDYAAAKSALNVLATVLSEEFGKDGIRVNTVLPGAVLTPMWENPGGSMDVYRARTDGHTTDDELRTTVIPQSLRLPIPRMGTAEECARAILFLASDEASYITGATLPVAGGMR